MNKKIWIKLVLSCLVVVFVCHWLSLQFITINQLTFLLVITLVGGLAYLAGRFNIIKT
jgi:hypothetical protein